MRLNNLILISKLNAIKSTHGHIEKEQSPSILRHCPRIVNNTCSDQTLKIITRNKRRIANGIGIPGVYK